jgi:hypothetical protein
MEDILGYFLVSLFVEAIFWGVAYTTGRIFTPIISLGRWRAHPLLINSETGKKEKKQTGLKLIEKKEGLYLGALGVCLVGFSFWGIVIVALIVI